MVSVRAQAFQFLDTIQSGAGKTFSYIIRAVYYVFFLIAKPIDWLLTALAKVQGGSEVSGVSILALSPVFKLIFAFIGFLYVFSIDSKDSVISQSTDEKFGLHVLLARGTIFFSALVSGFIGLCDLLVRMASRVKFSTGLEFPNFEGKFSGNFIDAIYFEVIIISNSINPVLEYFDDYGKLGIIINYDDPGWEIKLLDQFNNLNPKEIIANIKKVKKDHSLKSIYNSLDEVFIF